MATISKKAVNYTDVQTVKLLALYAEGNTTEAIASAMGKSLRSIVAKLSREGVYTKKSLCYKIRRRRYRKGRISRENLRKS